MMARLICWGCGALGLLGVVSEYVKPDPRITFIFKSLLWMAGWWMLATYLHVLQFRVRYTRHGPIDNPEIHTITRTSGHQRWLRERGVSAEYVDRGDYVTWIGEDGVTREGIGYFTDPSLVKNPRGTVVREIVWVEGTAQRVGHWVFKEERQT